jgi:hypothetical protein
MTTREEGGGREGHSARRGVSTDTHPYTVASWTWDSEPPASDRSDPDSSRTWRNRDCRRSTAKTHGAPHGGTHVSINMKAGTAREEEPGCAREGGTQFGARSGEVTERGWG